MREILFRGKRTNNGEWVEGNLFIPDISDTPTQICIGTKVIRISYDINPKTIGQYTGLIDKNGKKIFEGDILKSESDGYIGVVKYNEIIASFVGEINDTTPEFYHYSLLNKGDVSKTTQLKETVVIGNIYDNPE